MADSEKIVLAIDQGTTGSTVVLMDLQGRALCRASSEFPQHFPRPGWVEHEPEQIWQSVLEALQTALQSVPRAADRIAAVGITNQRETMMLWERQSRRNIGRALVWQDRRTSELCAELSQHEARVHAVTGLVIDPYFSASKLAWLLAQDGDLRRDAESGELAFGTVDSFLIEKLGEGKNEIARGSLIEVTNASRTLLMDLRSRTWSKEMCDMWDVPQAVLPTIVPSAGVVARTLGVPGLPDGIPISGIAGDQHAALFGQGCIHAGDAKCTYGTGAFVLVNTGNRPLDSHAGLLTTLAWQIGDQVHYALEGASFIAGAAVQWLRDGLGLIDTAPEIESLARQVQGSEGVTFVPALTGLGAPYWDMDARGLISGITRGTRSAHLAYATLEAIAFQVDDLLKAMQMDLLRETGKTLNHLGVDGGASKNDLLMQMQADFSRLRVDRPIDIESTARGAGLLAAIGAGLIPSIESIGDTIALDKSFQPEMSQEKSELDRARWEQAVARTRSSVG